MGEDSDAQASLKAGLEAPFELLKLPDELVEAVLAKLPPKWLANFAVASWSCRGAPSLPRKHWPA